MASGTRKLVSVRPNGLPERHMAKCSLHEPELLDIYPAELVLIISHILFC